MTLRRALDEQVELLLLAARDAQRAGPGLAHAKATVDLRWSVLNML